VAGSRVNTGAALVSVRRAAWIAFAAVLCVCGFSSAHDVIVEQQVDIVIRPSDAHLVVQMHVPASAVAEAKLPTLADGTLDEARIGPALEIVGADAARNLDVWYDRRPIVPSQVTVRLSADRRAVDVALSYSTTGANGFSARLNAFTGAPLRPVRTTVQYVPASGSPQTVSVVGPPRRVAFDPTTADVISQVAARGLSVVLSGGDHLLWLLCVLLPIRRAREAGVVVLALLAGQLAAMFAPALLPNGLGSIGTVASLIAASALVMAALQTIVRARLPWVVALTAVFGILNGCAFGGLLVDIRPFAGSHQAAALAVFPIVVDVAELWIAAVIWGTRTWLATSGLQDGLVTITAAAFVAHTAVHRMLDRGQLLVQSGVVDSMRVVTWLTLGWALAMVAVALAELFRQRGAAARARLSGLQRA